MSLNLNTAETSPYIEAVNDARFVRTFGIIALVGSILIFIGGAVAIGVGLAVMGFGSGRFYKTLGLSVVILGILGFFLGPLRILASIVLAAGVALKGQSILKTLEVEGKEDADWQPTRKRALTGIVLSVIAVVLSLCWLALFGLALVSKAH